MSSHAPTHEAAPPAATEPVLDEAKIASHIVGGVTILFAVATACGIKLETDAPTIDAALVGVAGGVCTVVNWLVPLWRGRHARAVVTPVANPRGADGGALVPAAASTPLAAPLTADGEQLVALSTARAMAARAAADAAVSGQVAVLPVGTPTDTPWAEDSTLIPVL